MKLGVVEKTILKKACASLVKYLNENNGKVNLLCTSVNNWLSENDFPFELNSKDDSFEIILREKK